MILQARYYKGTYFQYCLSASMSLFIRFACFLTFQIYNPNTQK